MELNNKKVTKENLISQIQMTKTYSAVSTKAFKEKIYEICPEFEVDRFNKNVLNDIFLYINGEGNLDSSKGILLWGNIGTGKSTLLKIIAETMRLQGRGFKVVNCPFLAADYSNCGMEALNESTWNTVQHGASRPLNRGFDELGREPIPSRYYGNEMNVMQYVLHCRYDFRQTVKTFATTNLRQEAIANMYGEYIFDRIGEMCNFIELRGESRRK
jgi:DNA replication protein DnaC